MNASPAADENGHDRHAGFFGRFGGRYVAETLRPALDALADAFAALKNDDVFRAELARLQNTWVGRPTPLLFAENATRELGGGRVYVKMEGLAHTGAHKVNNALGQALLARRLGKTRVIAETGAGQHGLATAAVCAKLGLACRVYMGAVDMARQYPNVFAMRHYGAEVVAVESGARTLKDAVNAALRDWAASHADTHYLLGSALGPSPFPALAHYFQSVIGRETRAQLRLEGRRPDVLVACVGGGSNAIGFFSPFLGEGSGGGDGNGGGPRARLVGVEAGGTGDAPGRHAARCTGDDARVGIAQGYKSLFLMDADGQLGATHSISAGLDYPGVGPELAHFAETGRIEFTRATDDEALAALAFFARHEGVHFALESAHAAAAAMRIAPALAPDRTLVVHMSGRGDKDLFITAPATQPAAWKAFLESEVNRG